MNELQPFLLNTGRTLSQMALYTQDHPAVKTAVSECHRLLSAVLAREPEIVLSANEGKLIVNGRPPENVPEASLKPFLLLLETYDLHSLSFLAGVTAAEMGPFFRLASGELRRANIDIGTFLEKNRVEHIKINLARYEKIREDETVGADKSKTPEAAQVEPAELMKLMENVNLNDLLRLLVDRAIKNPEDRERIFQRAIDLVKKQMTQTVEAAMVEFTKEKARITSERERTEEVVETMADGVVVVDENGRVLVMNAAAEQLYGVKLTDAMGKPLADGVRNEQMVTLAKDLSTTEDRTVVKEVQLLGDQEVRKTLRASSAAVRDTNGRVVGMVSVVSDVTKVKELTRLQNEFMANVTHDLRAPIHAVKLALGAILEGSAGPTTGKQQNMLSLADRNIERLSRLIDDLLDFSKIEAGEMRIQPSLIELVPLLKDAAASMEAWAKNRNIALVFEDLGGVPPVFADGDRILQVVSNLLSNAIKFTPSGGRVQLRVSKSEQEAREVALIEVLDTGPGITKEDQARIFDRFVQLENKEKGEIRGTGLGLSICKAIVDLHKGRLWVESPPPRRRGGSVFSFTLPATKGSSSTVARAHKTDAPAAGSEARHSAAPQKDSFWKRLFRMGLVAPVLFAVASASAAPGQPWNGRVRRVLAPDTVQLEDGTRVRLAAVTSPDKKSPLYAEASAALRQWAERREARLEYGLTARNAAGEWVAYLHVDGYFVNEELVRAGLALVEKVPNRDRAYVRLLKAERDAREHGRGLWRPGAFVSAVPAPSPEPVAPTAGVTP